MPPPIRDGGTIKSKVRTTSNSILSRDLAPAFPTILLGKTNADPAYSGVMWESRPLNKSRTVTVAEYGMKRVEQK